MIKYNWYTICIDRQLCDFVVWINNCTKKNWLTRKIVAIFYTFVGHGPSDNRVSLALIKNCITKIVFENKDIGKMKKMLCNEKITTINIFKHFFY